MNQERHSARHSERNIQVTVVNHTFMYHLRKSDVQNLLRNVRCAWNQRRKEMLTLVSNVSVLNKSSILIPTHVNHVIRLLASIRVNVSRNLQIVKVNWYMTVNQENANVHLRNNITVVLESLQIIVVLCSLIIHYLNNNLDLEKV